MDQNEMQAIPLDEILGRDLVPIDVHILMPSGRYLLIAKAGSKVEELKKFRDRSIDAFHVKTREYMHLVLLTIREATALAGDKAASHVQKLEGIRHAMSFVFHEISHLGFTDQALTHAKLVNHTTLTHLAQNPRLADLLTQLDGIEDDGVKHSMTVSMVCAMLGAGHGWTKPGTIEKLSLGGSLHDIGKVKLPKELVLKPKEQLTADEKVILQSHAEGGSQLLAQAKSVPDDIVRMVLEHHECADGTGYPRGLKDLVTSPFGRVLSLANTFVDLMQDDPTEDPKERAHNAIAQIKFMGDRKFNKEAVQALVKIFPAEKSKAAS